MVNGIDQQSGTIKNEVVTETQKAVKALEPNIAQIVHGETEKQVTASVDPVQKADEGLRRHDQFQHAGNPSQEW